MANPENGIRRGGDCNSLLATSYCTVLPSAKLHTLCVYVLYTTRIRSSMAKEKIINFRIDSQLKKEAKRLAEADGRSLSNWITLLIEREIKRVKKGG